MKEHIVSTYDDDLNTLKTKLLEMGVLVERQIFQAIEVTKIINLSKAKEIQKGDDAIDALEVEIREFATKTLTKRQPLADDLRKIIISLKISSIRERYGVTINSVYETCFREHLHIMMEDREIIGFSTQMLFIAKELERIGDLSKVISKEVIYNLKGKIV